MKLATKHLWLFARIEMGISRAEFNAMTPADFRVAVALWKQRETRKMRHADALVARLAWFQNLSTVPRKLGDKLPKLDDFLPVYGKKKSDATRRLTDVELQRKTEAIFSQHG